MITTATESISAPRLRVADVAALLVRWVLGGLFIYMGLSKALHPVEFLKLVRQYNITDQHLVLNFIASTLPWFEIFCGLLLVLGIAARSTALLLVAMLIPFTLLILRRALAIHGAEHIPFCAIKFDCGCGAGEVLICRKLLENTLLTAVAIWLMFWRHHIVAVRAKLLS
ncbi:MAG TPA: DoxX family protein [Verrucomicrobiae bacterium]|nr:DoxX family protein [Verrucomicrobiae bacterium]